MRHQVPVQLCKRSARLAPLLLGLSIACTPKGKTAAKAPVGGATTATPAADPSAAPTTPEGSILLPTVAPGTPCLPEAQQGQSPCYDQKTLRFGVSTAKTALEPTTPSTAVDAVGLDFTAKDFKPDATCLELVDAAPDDKSFPVLTVAFAADKIPTEKDGEYVAAFTIEKTYKYSCQAKSIVLRGTGFARNLTYSVDLSFVSAKGEFAANSPIFEGSSTKEGARDVDFANSSGAAEGAPL